MVVAVAISRGRIGHFVRLLYLSGPVGGRGWARHTSTGSRPSLIEMHNTCMVCVLMGPGLRLCMHGEWRGGREAEEGG